VSLLERHSRVPVAPINPVIFQQAMSDPRLSDRSSAGLIIFVCNQVAQRRGLAGL
jgi:hypothetical protein